MSENNQGTQMPHKPQITLWHLLEFILYCGVVSWFARLIWFACDEGEGCNDYMYLVRTNAIYSLSLANIWVRLRASVDVPRIYTVIPATYWVSDLFLMIPRAFGFILIGPNVDAKYIVGISIIVVVFIFLLIGAVVIPVHFVRHRAWRWRSAALTVGLTALLVCAFIYTELVTIVWKVISVL